jgi:hypothetical protein
MSDEQEIEIVVCRRGCKGPLTLEVARAIVEMAKLAWQREYARMRPKKPTARKALTVATRLVTHHSSLVNCRELCRKFLNIGRAAFGRT